MGKEAIRLRYASLLDAYVMGGDETPLTEIAELGRALVSANVPPEEIAELHEYGVEHLAQASPVRTLLECASRISTPLVELLMAYGLAFRQRDIDLVQQRSALRESERRFQSFAEIATDWFFETDDQWYVTYVSENFEAGTGLAPEEVLGRSCQELLDEHVSDRQALIPPMTTARAREPIRQLVVEWRTGFDEPKVLAFRGNPVFSPEGTFLGYRGTATDVTAQHRAAQERRQIEDRMRQSQKMEALGQLTGGIAHDFNNVLGSILGYTQLAVNRFDQQLPSDMRRYLAEIEHAGKRARSIIGRILDYSRASPDEAKRVAAETLVSGVADLLRSTIDATVRLEVRCESGLPEVRIDPAEMEQVLLNLAINARDAMEHGGTLSLSARRAAVEKTVCDSCHDELAGQFIALGVEDGGCGMAPEVCDRIFEPFFTTKPLGKGTGLGLWMAHGQIHASGGHLLLDTEIGRGTTFTILLPIAEGPCAPAKPKILTAQSQCRLADSRLLVVDDDESIAGLIKEVFEGEGSTVIVESHSPNALARVREDPDGFDLLVVDQRMPDLSGLELVQAMRSLGADLPVLMCSGSTEDMDRAVLFEAGIGALLHKPIDLAGLVASAITLIQGGGRR